MGERYRRSILSGEGWVQELLTGHPLRIVSELGVSHDVFAVLIATMRKMGLRNSKDISLQEKLSIFLYASVTGIPTAGHLGGRFDRSEESITRYFSEMVVLFSSPPFYTAHVRLPTANDPCPSEIQDNTKFFPFFKDALGALGGNHIPCSPPAYQRASFRNFQGEISQNCLFACTFSSHFVYSLCGWEGSVEDYTVYEDARSDDLVIPEGKYYLADGTFPSCAGLLTPYRGVRYHLPEWARSGARPSNKEELFNFRHASARNVMERLYGVWKQNYRILQAPPWSSLEIQVRTPAALCALHNFIRDNETDEEFLNTYVDFDRIDDGYDVDIGAVQGDEDSASVRRDAIAQSMWEDYMHKRMARGATEDDDEYSSDDEMTN